jgi:division protein CdvB (Snf7/Vps24/ESCRT-III family)
MATDIADLRFRIDNMKSLLETDMIVSQKENIEASEVARMMADALGLMNELAAAVQDLQRAAPPS